EDNNPVLYYKLQGQIAEEGYDLQKSDFFIVLQSQIQKNMLTRFGHKGICCDSTHGTNAYDFTLTTILVMDEFDQGFPVGWCLSSHEDFITMTIFIREIRKNCGVIQSKFFMSDMAPQFYNAWIAIMEGLRPAKLICTWHTDKAWQLELRRKIGSKQVQEEVYKMMRTALQETNEDVFEKLLLALLNYLGSKTIEFYEYFRKDWVLKKKEWAYCYRKGMGINTNMYVEAFHRVFKRVYLKGKVNKRVDTCLVNLMQYVRDKAFNRMIKMTKGKLSYRINNISKRHKQSLLMSPQNAVTVGDGVWSVSSDDNKHVYRVVLHANCCPEDTKCKVRCKECNICIHQSQCTCPDSLITTTICKHIHLAKRLAEQKENEHKKKVN
ncbi:uncharacterized protein LOC116617195, partial [Nematostella vectensis]|uniref:uncharacterized protein LOC116617195 n=1 Tax=Nematostella vectensis TaxID=45351 RepID=UPI0020771CC2